MPLFLLFASSYSWHFFLRKFGQTGKGNAITGLNFAIRSLVLARQVLVVTSHPLAARAGLDVLKQRVMAMAVIAENAMYSLCTGRRAYGSGNFLFLVDSCSPIGGKQG